MPLDFKEARQKENKPEYNLVIIMSLIYIQCSMSFIPQQEVAKVSPINHLPLSQLNGHNVR